jgi:hypothetical protein
MKKRLGSWAWLMLAVCPALGTGCVERRFIITTDPPGAIVYDWKSQPLSASPADTQFTYYGKYKFTLVKDGYETLIAEEQVRAPWYQWFLLDFVSENLVPWTIRDVRTFHYQLRPMQLVPPDVLLQSATEMRAMGQALGPPRAIPEGPGEAAPPVMPKAP